MSPSTAVGVGTVFEAGRYSTSGEEKNGCVVYSLIFFVYSSSTAILGSRTNGCVCARIGDCNMEPARTSHGATSFLIEPSLDRPNERQMLANRPALKQLRHAPVCVGLALVATACSSPTPAPPWDRQVKVTGSIL